MVIKCPRCNQNLVLPDEVIGRMVGCAYCRHQFIGAEYHSVTSIQCDKDNIRVVVNLANEIMAALQDGTSVGVPPDMELMERLAEKDPEIAFECGEIYYYGKDYNCGQGFFSSNYEKARQFYMQAVALGNARAAEMLYQMDLEPSSEPTPWADLIHWAVEGAHLGSVSCAMNMGFWLSKGIPGILEKDRLKSLEWFVKAYRLSSNEDEKTRIVDEAKRANHENLTSFLN